MKKIIYIFLLFISEIYSAQEYPLHTDIFEIPDNAYLKDVNNEYDKYIGLWKGEWNGKTLYLELKKVKYYHAGLHPFYSDEIFGERKVMLANGSVEIDRISNFDYQHPEIFGMGIPASYNNKLSQTLLFYPKNMCNKTARLIITNFMTIIAGPINNPNTTIYDQMTLHFEYLPSFYNENCVHNSYVDQNGDFPINFPKDIVLTKQ
ncbi:DUF6705 family protein [Chryseobacterium wangxinyae]|uniref:DUF6705 family protein n=1 Tax=Chryseobacterium sp. CY353 TaxID=2997334 RepID=UPI002271EB46|nr:DUF6705 family protein [Chryseobacterium sp. CY353]MCY0968746.1 hypothetical protein [Chryseobacterium sp. CY353]